MRQKTKIGWAISASLVLASVTVAGAVAIAIITTKPKTNIDLSPILPTEPSITPPTGPVETEKPVTGEYFVFSNLDNKTELIGLTDEGKTQQVLKIPSTVTSIASGRYDRSIFSDALNLETLDLSECSAITTIQKYSFLGAPKLSKILLPKTIVELQDGCFSKLISLTTIELSDQITSIGKELFDGCINLTNVKLPNTIQTIPDRTFYGCNALSSVVIPDTVSSIGWNAFNSCVSLAKINLPNSINIIDQNAFLGCISLVDINIPSSVTSIENYAFLNCTSLSSITLLSSITYIGIGTFDGCDSLEITVANEQIKLLLIASGFDEAKIKF